MAGERRFTRIPPESTGDRIYMVHTAQVQYDGLVGNHVWQIGEFYTVSGNGGDTITIHVHGVDTINSLEGYLQVHYDRASKFDTTKAPSDNQEIRDGDGNLVAYVNTTPVDVYINTNHIMGYDNPEYGLNIDRFGAANIRFAEGSPVLSSYNALNVSKPKLIAQYNFVLNSQPTEFSNTLIGSGSVTWDSNAKYVKVATGTDVGDLATNTTNIYHPYSPGGGTEFQMESRLGRTDNGGGSGGGVARWGAFDNQNGFFFMHSASAAYVVHRFNHHSGSSAIVKNVAIAQENWNYDTLDGTGGGDNPSGMNLDVTANNIYWMDFQHEAASLIRWGVYYKGEKVVCHVMNMSNNPNNHLGAHNAFRNPALPMCWSVYNQSSTAEGLNLYAYSAVAHSPSDSTDLMTEASVRRYDTSIQFTSMSSGTKYAFTLRPILQYPGGSDYNHTIYKPEILDFSAHDQNGNFIPMEIRLFQKCIMRGTKFDSVDYSTVDFDEDGDHLAHGPEIVRFVTDGSGKGYDFTKLFTTIQNGAVKNRSEATTSRRTQQLTQITTGSATLDLSSGLSSSWIKTNIVGLTVGYNPDYGPLNPIRHFFDDLTAVTIRNTGTVWDGNEYYLALESSNDATMYNSVADITDDRTQRKLLVSDTSSAVVGDYIYVVPEMTASITEIGTNTFTIEGRTTSSLDNIPALTSSGAPNFSTTSGGSGTVVSASLAGALPRDYKTKLLAVTGSGANDVYAGSSGELYGTPPAQAAWTFMVRPLITRPDSEIITTRWGMSWKELNQ